MNNIDWTQTIYWGIFGALIGLALAIIYLVLRASVKAIFAVFRKKK